MAERGPWTGVLTILRFNWPWFLGALLVASGAAFTLATGTPNWWLGALAWAALAGSTWLVLGSLLASHWIYDRSDLYRFGWLARVVSPQREKDRDRTQRFVFCHSGFDECSAALAAALPGGWQILDHFTEARMTEPSIRRAQRESRTIGAVPAPPDAWPVEAATVDTVFAILAIHELRSHELRSAWFAEARRCLAPTGTVVLIEHLRGLPNLCAFGPGFLHFHSRATWSRAWRAAGLTCRDEFPITPFVRAFVLTAPTSENSR